MRKALHALKYRRDTSLAGYLVDLAFPRWPLSDWGIQAIVPVPMGRQRESQRGYNQARLIAEAVSKKTGLPLSTESLVRIKETRSQVGLTLVERQENLRNAFAARPVDGKRILIVDDVCTTGATLEGGAKALRNSGAEAVFGIAIARAIPAVLIRCLADPHPITGGIP
jgi:ComF family protein